METPALIPRPERTLTVHGHDRPGRLATTWYAHRAKRWYSIPSLAGRPIVVLSNNDGCIVGSRSQEAKALGIAMGVPLFQAKRLVERHDVTVLSSNYALYGDLSERVMSILAAECAAHRGLQYRRELPRSRPPGGSRTSTRWCRDLRTRVHRWTGIPQSIG